jgi:hypothetical protein
MREYGLTKQDIASRPNFKGAGETAARRLVKED